MINLYSKFLDIKDSNLVFLVENKSDLKLLNEIKLDKNIITKIESVINSEKNDTVSFFLGAKNFENLYVLYFNEKGDKTLIEFLGGELVKFPSKLTIFSNNDKNLLSLLDTTLLSRYKFDKYKTDKKEDEVNVVINNNTEKLVKNRLETLENIIFARDLGETPSCDLYPESFAKIVKSTKFKNVKVKIFDSKHIEKKGLNLLHRVGKGSSKGPYMVIFERIIDKDLPTIGLVGKGITFDTGGIQVKPGDSMYEMKGDMCGAATVFSTMKELDNKDLNVNIVACLVLAENHISGDAYKPSDIIKSYSGKTVDIVHTDAEGRLVLADGVSYISMNYKLDKIVTVATLTGAVMVALGFRYAGIMGNDKNLINKFIDYSKNHFEKYVELPFDNYFIAKTRESKVADLENLNRGVYAGSSMGAAFLSNFVLNNEKYTHIDIAGTALNSFEAYGLFNKGMTGFGVDSLSKIIMDLK
ncbi:MAG: leucyl aminopeptidase family protein [Candidatus Gracilibacteria bacterium]|nr:leucyl aminopeptidase family protein [Candidatus Gracilibacteria bacterium]